MEFHSIFPSTGQQHCLRTYFSRLVPEMRVPLDFIVGWRGRIVKWSIYGESWLNTSKNVRNAIYAN